MANVLCLDFDDTITIENTARQLFERYAGEAWLDDEAAYHRGELSVEQFNAAALDRVEPDVSRDEMEAFVLDRVEVRAGFLELIDWCTWNDWQAVVVSNGFDLYVEPVLEKLGLDRVVRHAGRTSREYRWRARYLSPRGIELERGFKVSYAQAFRSAGDFVAYVGDGTSDVAAARLARAVFARSSLWDELREKHERVFHFETFDDIREVMTQEADGWLRSFSSTTAAVD